MKKLKLNEGVAKEFFEGKFGEIYTKDTINSFLKTMNESNADEMETACGFFNEKTMDREENDVEIIITCKLKKIDG